MKTINSFNKTAKIMDEYKNTGFLMSFKNAKRKMDYELYKSEKYSEKLAEWKELKIKKADLETIKDAIQGGNGSRDMNACIAELESRRDEAINESEKDVAQKVISLPIHTKHKTVLEQQCKNNKDELEQKFNDISFKGRAKVIAEIESEIFSCQNEIERLGKENKDFIQENNDTYSKIPEEEFINEVSRQTIQNEINDIQKEIDEENARIHEIIDKAKTYLKLENGEWINTNEAEYNKLRDEHNTLVNNVRELDSKKGKYQKFLDEISLDKTVDSVKPHIEVSINNEIKGHNSNEFLNNNQQNNNNYTRNSDYNKDSKNNNYASDKNNYSDEKNDYTLDETLNDNKPKTKNVTKAENDKNITKDVIASNTVETKNISVRIVKGEDGVNKFVYGQIDENGDFLSTSTYSDVFKEGEYGEFTTNQYDVLLKGFIDRGYKCNDNNIIVFGDAAKRLDPLLLTYLDMNGMGNEAKAYSEAILSGDMTEFNKLVKIEYDLSDIKGLKYGEKLICKELAQKAKGCELNVKEPQTFLKNMQDRFKSAIEKVKSLFKKQTPMLEAPQNIKTAIPYSEKNNETDYKSKAQFVENLRIEEDKLTPEFTIDSMDKEFEKYQPSVDKNGNKIIVNEQKDKDGNVVSRRSIRADSQEAKRFLKKWNFGVLWKEALLELDGKNDIDSEIKEDELKSRFGSDQSKSLYSFFINSLRRQMMKSDSIDLNQIVDSIQKGENETLKPDKALAKLLGTPENVKTVMEFAKMTVPENKIKADMTKVEEYKEQGEERRKNIKLAARMNEENEIA